MTRSLHRFFACRGGLARLRIAGPLLTLVALLALAGCEAKWRGVTGAVLPTGGPAPPAETTTAFAPPRGRVVESLGSPSAPPVASNGPVRPVLPVVTGNRLVSFAYDNAEVTRVVHEVMGDVLGLQVTMDPDLTGRMTFRTTTQIPLSEVPQRLNDALQPLGYGIAAVSGGGVRVGRIAVLQAAAAAAALGPRFVPMHFVPANEVVAAVQGSLPEGVRVAPDPGNTAVIISGPTQGADAAEQLIRLFDVDMLRGRSFIVYPLSNASASAVAREFSTVFGGDSRVTVQAVNRLNAVLVVTDQSGLMPRIRTTLAQLDTAQDGAIGMRVFPIQNRRAADVAVLLARIFGAPAPAVPPQTSPAGDFGGLSVGAGTAGSTAIAARPPTIGGNNQQGAALTASAGAGTGGQTEAQFAEDLGLSAPVRVQVDNVLNAVVVLAAPADLNLIAQTIRRLDMRPQQVFIEAVVAEVQLNDQLQFGLDYAFRTGSANFSQAFPANTAFNELTPIPGGFTFLLQTSNARVTLQALSSITDVHVVSAPRLLVVDNETATLQVGDQVPILTEFSQSQDSTNAPVVNQVELRDTGVILAVRPRIGAGGVVSLDIFQEVSNAVSTTTSGISSPTIQLRRLQSAVNVQSGQTVALGGLMSDNVTRSNNGIPILNRIPIIGPLFGARSDSAVRQELLVMLTPRVVDDAGVDIQAVTEELRTRINSLAPDVGRMITPGAGSMAPPPRDVLQWKVSH
jgi:general secretion pathway protein D